MLTESLCQVNPYLNEIADCLWSNRAAVMVGAGFSQNAKTVGRTSASFPSWQKLGDIFFEKLYGRCLREEARYLNILKLAEQVEATFGRPTLDTLLRRAIPDLRYEPSPLHSQLLNLPWKDIFTTNYDTLLERARTSVILKHYDVVAKKDDLLYANQPRIVKLHGSFPSPPFIITEEDYRRYINDHAPFVNTVRQSLLENTLCLIGFSGHDPNFLQWVGWIRDHIGKETAPKIYLVGVFSTLDEGERKLLDYRGIIMVDLSEFSSNPRDALNHFLNYLDNRKPRALDWPTDSKSVPDKPSKHKLHEIVVRWRRQRGEYPGWIVMPKDLRQLLWSCTQPWLLVTLAMSSEDWGKIEEPLSLDLAFELAWRLDRCLFPLHGQLLSLLENIAEKYSKSKGRLQLPENTHWTNASIFEAITKIRLWLLRYYRERGLDRKWEEVKQMVIEDFERLLPEYRARFRLEEALQELFRFNPDTAKRLLVDSWQSNTSLPFWEAKRAALMAELGEVAAARSILETSLSAIRQQLSLSPVIEDYTIVSQESIVMLLIWAVEQTAQSSEDSSFLNEMSERWDDLGRYKCDPRHEIELLYANLQHSGMRWKLEGKTYCFDLEGVSTKSHFRRNDRETVVYGMLRMYEDIGMPYRIGDTPFTFMETLVKSMLHQISPYFSLSPHWALVNIMRLGKTEATDELFNREYLSNLRCEEVNRLFDVYLPAFKRVVDMVNGPDLSKAQRFKSLAKIFPEVLSHLCHKCSQLYREQLVGILCTIYGSRQREMFTGISLFAKRLFESMSIKERIRMVSPLIELPIPDLSRGQEFFNPVLWIRLPRSSYREIIPIAEETTDKLLDQLEHVKQGSDWVAASLIWLHRHSQLNKHQSDQLGRLLWDGSEAPELPTIANHYPLAWIASLPHPEDVDPELRIREYLQSMIGKGMGDSKVINYFLNKLRDSVDVVKWSKLEALELFTELSRWWEQNKHMFGRRRSLSLIGVATERDEYIINQIIYTLSEVFSRLSLDKDDEGIKPLLDFLKELTEYGIPAKVLDAAILREVPKLRKKLITEISEALLDNDDAIIYDALLAAKVLAQKLAEEKLNDEFAPIAIKLVQGIQWRHSPRLDCRLHTVAGLVEEQCWFLSPEILTDLLTGLEQIAKETSGGVRGNDEDGIISIRRSAASLAFALFRYYQKSKSSEPEVVRHWRELCKDPNEFSDVRTSWLIAGG